VVETVAPELGSCWYTAIQSVATARSASKNAVRRAHTWVMQVVLDAVLLIEAGRWGGGLGPEIG
jgi:hypothetical protein